VMNMLVRMRTGDFSWGLFSMRDSR
jgi:hypothetical protein